MPLIYCIDQVVIFLARWRRRLHAGHAVFAMQDDLTKGIHIAGYAIVEEELEVGLRSIAVPVRGASGNAVAALNTGAQATCVTRMQME